MQATPERVIQRVMSNYRVVGECWFGNYSTIRGYPQIGWTEDGKRYHDLCHRVAWEAANGRPVPDGMTVDHMRTVCVGPPCIRPEHLRVLSHFENSRRTYGRDWPLGQCVNGHPNSEMVWASNQRRCRACHKIYMQQWNRLATEKRRAAKAAAAVMTNSQADQHMT